MSVHLHRCPVEGCRTILVTEPEPPPADRREEPATEARFIDIVFDGPPSPEAGRFVEVEDPGRRSMRIGWWIDRGDGFWVLRIEHEAQGEQPAPLDVEAVLDRLIDVVLDRPFADPDDDAAKVARDARKILVAAQAGLSNQPSTEPAQGGTG